MYKLGLVGIYEIGFLKADFDHGPGFYTTIKLLLQVYPERSEGPLSSLCNTMQLFREL